jgi:N-methylhydantoinase A
VIENGAVRETGGGSVGGRPVALPMLDLHTVGAGGGSIAWRDAGGALRVGPHSAGARPGPAAYGHGGIEPTVTDANVALGYLDRLAGGLTIDGEAARRALDTLDLEHAAEGIRRVANAEMVRALRVMTVERGVDPRGMALVAFGGAGPLHAAAIADELGMDRVLCPRASGVLAALGLVVSERRRDVQRSLMTTELAPDISDLAARAREELGAPDAQIRAVADLRYAGQAFELPVPLGGDLREAFERAHEEAYGFRDPSGEVELVTVRVTAAVAGPDVDPHAPGAGAERLTRQAVFGGELRETAVIRGEPEPGTAAAGPAIFELPESTVVVPPGWSAEVDATGTVRLTR